MRIGKFGAVAVGILIVLLFSACGGGGSKPTLDLMKKVPVDSTSFSYWNVKTLGTKDESLAIYEKFKNSPEITQLINKQSGIAALLRSDIDTVGRASGFGMSNVTMLAGEMDINGIQKELNGRGDYQSEVYEKAPIWTPVNTDYKSIAIVNNIIIVGEKQDIKACLDLIALEPDRSLDSDKSISLVMDRLPGGVLVQAYKAGVGSVVAEAVESYQDLKVYAKSYELEEKGELRLTAVYMFEDFSATNSRTQSEITVYYEAKGFSDIKIERLDEKYLKVSAVIQIDDFTNILIW